MKKLFISFSAREKGNCDEIINYLAGEQDKRVYFRDLNVNNCKNCSYECFEQRCKYRDDGLYSLFDEMGGYQKIVLVVPIYSGNPSSLYFTFNERSQDYFMHNEDQYGNIVKKLFIIGVCGDCLENPDFIPCFEKWFLGTKYKNHVLAVERRKYNLKLKDSVLEVEEIKNVINEFINPTKAFVELCAMAVVTCKGKILTTNEQIYGKEILSLPKGHKEKDESIVETAIRECFEETNITVSESDLVKQLTPFSYEFLTSSNKLIRKTIVPFYFKAQSEGNPLAKEERINWVKWMDIYNFLNNCAYESVKKIVEEVLSL